jgi:hypothetical protein
VSDRTYKSYAQAFSVFSEFCSMLGYDASSGASVQLLAEFIAWLSLAGRAAATISLYVAGIGFWHKIRMLKNPVDDALIHRLLSGIRRDKPAADIRQPITVHVLRKLIAILPSVTSTAYEACMLRAAFSIAFYGFLRLGEFTASSKKSTSDISLLATDVNIIGHVSRRAIEITLRRSKNNQRGPSQRLIIQPIKGRGECPVQAVIQYIAARPRDAAAFLCHYDLSPLTRHEFQRLLKQITTAAGLGEAQLSSHSFRIGAATEAAARGLTDEQIMAFGRWRSEAYRSYIRPSAIIPSTSLAAQP